ncbi:TolC family protein [Undibacterium sp. TJN25]|uniref:TolC family protein n=1 Tax=Undibacterium sp. TJN25 TaxID=3413056 RepID=UPI003BF3A63D
MALHPAIAITADLSDSDPLHSRPTFLATGVLLPGDTLLPPCGSVLKPVGALSLVQAVDLALCNNPHIKGAWALTKIQAEALGEAKSAYLPTLSTSIATLSDRTSYPGHPDSDNHLTGLAPTLGITWRLFDFGERDANRRSAQATLNAALSNHEAVLQKTLSSVISAYFDVQTQMSYWQTRQQNEELAHQTLTTVKRREMRGTAAQSDTLQAETALAKAGLERNRAYGGYQKSLSVLIYSMGITPDAQVTVLEDAPDTSEGVRQELRDWLWQARQHPAIAAARASVEAAQQKMTALRSQGLPTVDFAGNIYQNGRPNQGLSPVTSRETIFSITLTLPLFDGFGNAYRLRGAQAQVEQKEADLENTEHEILLDVLKAHSDANAAFDNLTVSQLLLSSAEAALNSVQRKFDKGAADILDMLSAQAALSDARQERVRCQADWRSARLTLMAAAGALGRQALKP